MKNKKIIGIVILLIILIASIIGFLLYSNRTTVRLQKQLDLGNRYLQDMEYEQAIVAFEIAIEIEPKCVEAYIELANVYSEMGKLEDAKEILKNGYQQTMDDSLSEALKKLEINAENAPINNKTGESTETEKMVQQRDSRFEACVVDGVYHHGYEYYDLNEEDNDFFAKLIKLAKDEKIVTI